jgi:hypothetical protein
VKTASLVPKSRRTVETLLERVPELAASHDVDPEVPYAVFGEFGSFLCEQARRHPPDDELLRRCFAFIDEMAASDDDEVLNILVTGTFEVLSDDDNCSALAKRMLDRPAAALLDRVEKGWATGGHH